MTTVAVLGMGAMGSRMAHNLLKSGHRVVVYNRTVSRSASLKDKGATVAQSPREAAEQSEMIISVVRDDAASREVWFGDGKGALHGLKSGAIAIESSTVTTSWVQELDSAVRAKGAHFLSAPVVGSLKQAEAGQLIYLVSGDESVAGRAQPVILDMGAASHYVGAVENAAVFKLAVNALLGVQVAAVSELLALLSHSGLEEGRAVEVLCALPTMSPAAKGAAALILERSFTPLFTVDLIEKDLSYALHQAEVAGTTLPTTTAVRAVFQKAQESGLGDENMTAVFKLFNS